MEITKSSRIKVFIREYDLIEDYVNGWLRQNEGKVIFSIESRPILDSNGTPLLSISLWYREED